MLNLTAHLVQLNEELHEKQVKAENDLHLKSDVDNFERALSSISKINSCLDLEFLDTYDNIAQEIGARINELEMENAIVNDQGIKKCNCRSNGK